MSKAEGSSKHRKLTQAELMAEAKERFGEDVMTWAFRCPSCGDVASLGDFKVADADPGLAGQECIGRHLGALSKAIKKYKGRGCDWAAYGLFRGPWEIELPADGNKPVRSAWSFPLADAVVVSS
jgi:hypothetical protein